MPEAEIEFARDYCDAFRRGGPGELYDRYWAGEVVWHDFPGFPDAQVFRGRDAVRARLEELLTFTADWDLEVEEIVDGEGSVMVHWAWRSGGPVARPVPMDLDFFVVLTPRHGRVAVIRNFTDRSEALRAASA